MCTNPHDNLVLKISWCQTMYSFTVLLITVEVIIVQNLWEIHNAVVMNLVWITFLFYLWLKNHTKMERSYLVMWDFKIHAGYN